MLFFNFYLEKTNIHFNFTHLYTYKLKFIIKYYYKMKNTMYFYVSYHTKQSLW